MTVVQEYLETLSPAEQKVIIHLYDIVYQMVPEAEAVVSYGMPALSYKGKPFVAIMKNARFLSLYPFCNLERLSLDLTAYECTKGSIHFTADKPLTAEILRNVIKARLKA